MSDKREVFTGMSTRLLVDEMERLANVLAITGGPATAQLCRTAALRLRELSSPAAPDLLAVVEELLESAEYWSEYDVPLGIVDRMKAAIDKAKEHTP